MTYSPKIRVALPLIALIASSLLSGCNTVPTELNSVVKSKLPTMLGPADSYDVSSNGDILELMRGKLRHLHIHGTNVQLSPLLSVSSFTADASDIHANTRTDQITKIGTVTFEADLDQHDMDNYMSTAQPIAVSHGAKITLDGNNITYSDNVGVWVMRTPFSVTGTLVRHPGNASQLDFSASRASLAHLRIPDSVVTTLVKTVNPVVDLSKMKYPVTISSEGVNNSIISVSGSVDPKSLLNTAPGDQP